MLDKAKLIGSFLVIAVSVWGYYFYADLLQVARVGVVVFGVAVSVAVLYTTAIGKSALDFMKGANVERQKVIWPVRREAMQVTGIVIVVTVLLGLLMWLFDSLSFYFVYDLILQTGV